MRDGIFTLSDMIGALDVWGSPDGKRWFRAVPEPFPHGIAGRIRGAVAVLRGSAYPVRWPELGELEAVQLARLKQFGGA